MAEIDHAAAGDIVRDHLATAATGAQSALARSLNLSATSVNKWRKGYAQPSPEHWPGIEAFFELEPGTLRRAALGERALEQLAIDLRQAAELLGDRLSQSDQRAVARLVEKFTDS